ncbi:MAG TPA: beta-ketoacyl-[acyl-carrier-protein] synthase II [Anaerolineae bacterium]|nr:beta-ketoacyl-[acyl-carrier-protein] synthase II [Anaerolineae bacterium]
MIRDVRVVVTGLGVISPVGLDVPTVWQNLVAGRSGIGPITHFDASDFAVKIAGEARGFDPADYMSAKEARRTDRFVQFAIAAAQQAVAQARLTVDQTIADQVGVIVGAGMGGINTYSRQLRVLTEKGPRRVSPFLIPMITVDVAAVQIAILTGAKGPNFGLVSACSTGSDAIGQAYETIRRGDAQAVIAGGTEAAVTPVGVAAFDRMRALSHRNEEPERASRPFDAERDGFVMGEGGAIVILENLSFAERRGAEPLAEVVGYANTSDAVSLVAPAEGGMAAARTMALALKKAGLSPEEVDLVSAHGTSTPLGDVHETMALKRVFGARAYKVPISATKSMTGHLLGAAGALQAVITVMAVREGIIPPTINYTTPDPRCDLDYVPNVARRASIRVALSNSFGFGGHNVALVFKALS